MNRILAQSICLSASTLSLALAPDSAQAQTAAWSITGAACVPTGQTSAGVGTFNSAGEAGFPAGRVGEIIVTCPVPPGIARATSLLITYRDTDGMGTVVGLRAALRQKNLATGAVADVGRTLDSNGFVALAGPNAAVRRGVALGYTCVKPFIFDHSRFAYYVQVNMIRRGTAQDALLASVELGSSVLC